MASSANFPSKDVVISMSLAEFARQSFVLAGLNDVEIMGLGEALEFGEEEFGTVPPAILLAVLDAEFEEAMGMWEVAGRRAGVRLKARARHGRAIMKACLEHRRRLGQWCW